MGERGPLALALSAGPSPAERARGSFATGLVFSRGDESYGCYARRPMSIFRFCPLCARPLPTPTEPPERVVQQECAGCGAIHYRNAKPTASALVVRDGRVLLGRRSIEPHKDLWDVPGGFLEPWEDPLEGVRREVLEETGYEVEPGEVLAILVDVYDDPSVYTFNVYYLARIVGGEPRPADDVAELGWFGRDELPAVAFATGREALSMWKDRLSGRPGLAE